MRTIIHDLDKNQLNKLKFKNDDIVISSIECNKSCIGCFSCWIKTPKKCILNDNFSTIVENLKKSDEIILISKCRYGCYSSDVKRVLERCIGYVLPFFTIRNNEIHHENRYDKDMKLTTYFYGEIDEEEKKIINTLVKANSINLNTKEYKIKYLNNIEEIKLCTH